MAVASVYQSSIGRLLSSWQNLWQRFPLLRGYSLISPVLVLMLAGLISPFLLLAGISFTIETGNADDWVLSLANYSFFFEKQYFPGI